MSAQRTNPLFQEINRIINATNSYQHSIYYLDFYIDGKTHRAVKLTNFDIREDYQGSTFAEVFVEAFVPLGFFTKQVFKNKDNLEVFITERPFGPIKFSGGQVVNGSTSVLYRAILESEGTPTLEADKGQDIDEIGLDLSDVVKIRLQLLNKTVEQLRLIRIGGSYRSTDPQTLIETLLSSGAGTITAPQEYLPIGVDMKDADNVDLKEAFVFEHNTALIDVPGIVQKQLGGVYSTGLGHFIKDLQWYIYPLYNTENFNTDPFNLEVIIVPSNLIITLDRTWIGDGSSTMIVVTGEKKITEHSTKEQMNFGNGVRFADAAGFIERFVDTSQEGKAVATRQGRVNEFVSETSKREFDNAPLAASRITANPFNESSKLASRAGSYFTCAWDYSAPSRIKPGMNARIKYMDGNTLKVFQAVLVGAMHSTQLLDTGPAASNYVTSTALSFFVQRDLDVS